MEVEATTPTKETFAAVANKTNNPTTTTKQPVELIPTDEPISTKLVTANYAGMYKNLSHEELTVARTPFSTAFGKGDEAFHDPLAKMTRIVMKIKARSNTLQSEQIARCLNPGHTTDQWLEAMSRVMKESDEDNKALKEYVTE
jgi:hypothetical protein